jgi:Zn-dependent protease/predicted transcriptional regulator
MSWSIKVARIAGTEIRIHITFLLFLVWIGFIYYRFGGREAAITGVLFITLLFLCVLLHELGHALAARMFGIRTPDITLLPIGGVARLQRMPDKPGQEIIVALAGPAVNVLIAAVLMLATGISLDLSRVQAAIGPEASLPARLAAANIFLVLFNLIPAFPMDGGRVLRAVLAIKMPYGQATRMAARIGQGFAFVFGFLGLFGNPLLIFIALFIYIAASQEAAFASLKDATGSLSVADATTTEFSTLPADASAAEAAELLLRSSQHEFPVIDTSGRVVGMLTRDDIIRALQRGGPETPVMQVMQRDIPVVPLNASLDEAFRLMQECECPALPVVDSRGKLVGLVTPENVGELMMIRSVLPSGTGLAWRRAVA